MSMHFKSIAPWFVFASALAFTGCSAGEQTGGSGFGPGVGGAEGGDEEGECETPDGESCELPLCEDPCGYNDPDYESGDCRIEDYELECGDLRGVKITFQKAGATVPPPNAFFRGEDGNLQKWIEQRWNEMADFTIPNSVETTIENQNVEIHNYPAGNDWTRTDFHGAIMALPPGGRPEDLLQSIANDPIKATGNSKFAGWVGWPPASGDRKVGDIVDLDIYGPDNGAIAYWKMDTDRFCVVTVENDSAGWHPVSGIRCWGFVPIQVNPNWKVADNRWNCGRPTYLFYTMGIDSPTVPGGGTFGGVSAQKSTWNALMKDLSIQNQGKGGVSGRWMLQKTVGQPNDLAPGGSTDVDAPGELEGFYVGLPSTKYRDGEVCEAPDLTCGPDQFTCSDASCIPAERRCDGTSDCLDGDDEQACDGGGSEGACAANQFACSDGVCIPEDWRCDGQYPDCNGGEDEESCDGAEEPSGCAAGEFTCNDGECIPGAWKCDGTYPDCSSGEDEEGCGPAGGEGEGEGEGEGGGSEGSCAANEFTCNDGACIPETWQCDAINDCSANEDEANCEGEGGGACAANEFACNDGLCISETWQCDAIVDCAGGEDEMGC